MDETTHTGDSGDSSTNQGNWFKNTHWSLVLKAAGDPNSPRAFEALNELCDNYWYPLYAFLRREGLNKESAEDLTQGFFARLLEKNHLKDVHPDKGRFRTFLLVSLKNFRSDAWDKARAQKRGGGEVHVSFDASTAEERYQFEPKEVMDPEKLYARRFALIILEKVKARLETEIRKKDSSIPYGRLQTFLFADEDSPKYTELADEFEIPVGTVKAQVSRLRKLHRELLRAEVANTVQNEAEIDDEIRHLIRAIS